MEEANSPIQPKLKSRVKVWVTMAVILFVAPVLTGVVSKLIVTLFKFGYGLLSAWF